MAWSDLDGSASQQSGLLDGVVFIVHLHDAVVVTIPQWSSQHSGLYDASS